MISVLQLPLHQIFGHRAQVKAVILKALFAGVIHMVKGKYHVQLSPVVPRH